MDLSYNYGYLSHFMKVNSLKKREILKALGTDDYTSLNRWLEGLVPMHVTAMLRFCNYYQIPLDGFFFDGDTPTHLELAAPTEDSQTSPTDGYGMENGKRKPGYGITDTNVGEAERSLAAKKRIVTDGIAAQVRNSGNAGGETKEETGNDTIATASMNEQMLRMELDHVNELRRIEREYHEREDRIRRECQSMFDAERNRLMDIIERQNIEISKFYEQAKKNNARHGYVMEDGSEDA